MEDISTEEEENLKFVTPLVSMGASYINIKNVTKYQEIKIKKKLNPMKLYVGKDKKFLMDSVYTTNKEMRKNLDLNYKEWLSLTEPSWNSRFIMTPKERKKKKIFFFLFFFF